MAAFSNNPVHHLHVRPFYGATLDRTQCSTASDAKLRPPKESEFPELPSIDYISIFKGT